MSRKIRAILKILSRNTFLLINAIIFTVVIFLVIFGDAQEGMFLGLVTLLNLVIGSAQEINSWLNLEKLQLLAAPKIIRIGKDGSEVIVLVEDVLVKDNIKLKTGDQVPCDGVLLSSHGFEVNEGLITGESTAFLKKPGDRVLAGSIITSGVAVLEVEKIFIESRISLMTKRVKKYSLIQSPIQSSINKVIQYSGYFLLLIICYVVANGLFNKESTVSIVQSIGALTSMLLPQGMIVITTLLFSYGAIHLYRRHVLLQEVNATEKIGRIKNLCMDKTGTLTDNNLVIEHVHTISGVTEKYSTQSIMAYIKGTEDSSQTIQVIRKKYLNEYTGTVVDSLTFSSSRQFGVVHIKDDLGERVVLSGAPDIFLPYLSIAAEKEWMQNLIDTKAKIGKRLICFVQSDSNVLPQNLVGIKLKALTVFVLSNNLREGVKEAVNFFQDRGVTIRIISGDNPETVRAVALLAGVKNCETAVTGIELESWSEDDFVNNTQKYTIFARIKPEQKEKLIEVFKRDGFTAMIGDGANDALAIKKADLGIAMFDGAQATRQVASVVLVKNSFTDLPNGVKLADSIIQNIEISASLMFNQVFSGLFFFIILAVLNYNFPFTPLNITFTNYFTIGLPMFLIFYWVIRPVRPSVLKHSISFLRQVVPFALVSAIFQTICIMFAFYSSLEITENHGPTSLVALVYIIVSVIFFIHTPIVYSGPITKKQRNEFIALVIFEIISIAVLIQIPLVKSFYDLKSIPLRAVLELVPFIVIYALIQYGLVKFFFKKEYPTSNE